MQHLSAASKFNTDWDFLTELRDKGRSEGKKWLKAHFKDIGTLSTVDIQRDYLRKN
jgi:NTE family protein